MGTEIEAWTEGQDDGAALRLWFETVEDVCSRFRPDSELARLNRNDCTEIRVSGILEDVFEAASSVRDRTDGLVDVGSGAAVRDWGYDRSFGDTMGLEKAPEPMPSPVWSVSEGLLTRAPGVIFDFGGVAKGWTCDQAVESRRATVVSAGGDIRSNHPGTTVPIVDPWGNVATTVALGEGALATSSQTKRRWSVGSREVSHIIDPRSMAPTESPILSATVVAETATEAEAAAKTVLLMGDSGLEWADGTGWIQSALVVWHDGSVYGTHGIAVAV